MMSVGISLSVCCWFLKLLKLHILNTFLDVVASKLNECDIETVMARKILPRVTRKILPCVTNNVDHTLISPDSSTLF